MRPSFAMRYQNVWCQNFITSAYHHGMSTAAVNFSYRECGRLSSYGLARVNGDMASILFLPHTFYLQLQLSLVDADRVWMPSLWRGCHIKMQSMAYVTLRNDHLEQLWLLCCLYVPYWYHNDALLRASQPVITVLKTLTAAVQVRNFNVMLAVVLPALWGNTGGGFDPKESQ